MVGGYGGELRGSRGTFCHGEHALSVHFECVRGDGGRETGVNMITVTQCFC